MLFFQGIWVFLVGWPVLSIHHSYLGLSLLLTSYGSTLSNACVSILTRHVFHSFLNCRFLFLLSCILDTLFRFKPVMEMPEVSNFRDILIRLAYITLSVMPVWYFFLFLSVLLTTLLARPLWVFYIWLLNHLFLCLASSIRFSVISWSSVFSRSGGV